MAELRAIIESYRNLSIEEAEASDAGDREVEAVAELWRLEQAAAEHGPEPVRRRYAA